MSILSPYASCLAVLSGAVLTSVSFPLLGLAQQVVPDNTLGAESSVVTPLDGQTGRIDGGALRDATLFHSFEQFGIPENHGVYFANPAVVNTIFSRVTGAEPSLLFGTLGVLGDADLVFLNPHGILFGPNAELDLRGGFTATTASGVEFLGGEVFSAVTPEAAPVLSVNVQAPMGLVFGEGVGAIANAGTLTVDSEQGLSLISGVVVNEGSLIAPSGQISLTAVPTEHVVQVSSHGQVLSWDNDGQSNPLAGQNAPAANELIDTLGLDIVGDLRAGTNLVSGKVDVLGRSGGSVQVLGDRIALLAADLNASGQTGGGNLLIGGDYQGQDLLPTATQTYFNQGSTIQADALQSGDGGRVIVWADGSTHFYGDISARGGASSGNGGFVEISGKDNLAFQGFVDAGADNGANGTLLLDPRDIRIVPGSSGDNLPNGIIRDGNTIILPQNLAPATELRISEDALEALPADTNLRLEASRNIFVESLEDSDRDDGTQPDLFFSPGPGGTIEFIADADNDGEGSFIIEESSVSIAAWQRDILISGEQISIGSIETFVPISEEADPSPGDGGSITLRAIGDINTTGTLEDVDGDVFALASFVSFGRVGNGGKIEITSQNGNINTTSGPINSATPGDEIRNDRTGGEIIIQAAGNIDTADVNSSVLLDLDGTKGNGTGGRIEITSTNGAVNTTEGQVSSSAVNGAGGEILIQSNQAVTTGAISSSFGPNNLGNITLISNNGDIDATAGSVRYLGTPDDVDIRAAGSVSLASTNADTLEVDAGTIITSSGALEITESSSFTTRQADAGTVELSSESDIIFGNSIIGGDLIVDSESEVSQRGVLQVADDIEVNGNNSNGDNGPLVNTVGNPNQEATLEDGSVLITQVGTVVLEAENYPASLTVNSLSEGILGFNTVLDNKTAIDLSDRENSFGGPVQFRTAIGDAETVEGIPGITQSGLISVTGAATFTAEDGNISLTEPENQFIDAVAFTGNDVALTTAGGLDLLSSKANGNLRIETGGVLQQSGALTVDGTLDLTITLPEAGNVTLANSGVTLFGQTLIGGELRLEPTIPGTDVPIFPVGQVIGTSIQAAGGDNLPVNFERDALPTNSIRRIGNDVYITDVGPTDVAAILDTELDITSVEGNLTVYSLSNALRFDETYTNQAIRLDNTGNQLRGAITIMTDAPTLVEEFGESGILQSEQLIVTGAATFNAVGGPITLTEVTNQFGELAFEGTDVTIQEQDATRLSESVATGALNLVSGGEITQQDSLQVNGLSNFTTLETDAPIVLDQANQLAGPISFDTEGTGDVTLTNTVNKTQLAASSIGGDLTVDSGSAITQTGSLTVSGTTTLNTGSNEISLTLGNDFSELAVTGSGTVDINDINTVELLDSRSFGDFTVIAQDAISSNNISVSSGTIQLTSEAENVDTTGGLLRARFPGGQGGNVDLRAAEDLTVGEILVSGFPSGNVNLTAENGTLLLDDFDVRSVTFGSGTGGTVTLNGDIVELANGGRVLAIAADTGTGGTVNVNARQFLIQGVDSNGSFDQKFITGIGTDTLPGTAANGGNQNINATELIQITGTRPGVFIPDQTNSLAVFEAGALRTGLTASSLGSGKAGDINLSTERLVLQNGVGVATAALGRGADAGDGGQVTVTARDIEFRGLAGLASATLGQGVAGDILVRGLGSTDEAPVPANQLFLSDGAVITADAIPEASQQLIDAFDLSDNEPVLTGQAGNIEITANDVLLDNFALITTSSTTGSGGDIILDNVGVLRLRRGNGVGGIITDGGTLRRTGNGGQIDITADLIFAVDQENSDISATAFIGRGGGIEITTLTAPIGIEFRPDLTPFSDITAGSEQGPQGTVDINTSSLDPTQGIANLPDEPSAPEIIEGCRVSGNREATQFFNNGREGIRPQPEDSLTPEITTIEWLTLDLAATTTTELSSESEDTGVTKDEVAIATCLLNSNTH